MGQVTSRNTGERLSKSNNSQHKHYVVEEGGLEDLLQEFVVSAVLGITVYCASTYIIRKFQDDTDGQPVDTGKVDKALRRRGRKSISMGRYEKQIAVDFVDPEEMDVTFDDIGGLEKQKEEIVKSL